MRLFKWIVEFTIELKMFFTLQVEVTSSVMGPRLHVTAVPHLKIYTISATQTSPC